jgi:hypothetical protein
LFGRLPAAGDHFIALTPSWMVPADVCSVTVDGSISHHRCSWEQNEKFMGSANIIHKAEHQMSLENEETVACVFFFTLVF